MRSVLKNGKEWQTRVLVLPKTCEYSRRPMFIIDPPMKKTCFLPRRAAQW